MKNVRVASKLTFLLWINVHKWYNICRNLFSLFDPNQFDAQWNVVALIDWIARVPTGIADRFFLIRFVYFLV